MPYYNQQFPGYQPGYQPIGQAMPDQLAQFRQPYQFQPMQQPHNVQPQIQPDPMIWVQGEAGAKAYMVAAGASVVLWDSEDPVIYIKSADQTGMPYMRTFEYVERNAAPRNVSPVNTNQFVTREEFNALAARINQMMPQTGGTEVINAE